MRNSSELVALFTEILFESELADVDLSTTATNTSQNYFLKLQNQIYNSDLVYTQIQLQIISIWCIFNRVSEQ